ncbi:MAG: hypothetical protein R2853_04920 [Thermomicrobiales bacterium]
MAASAGAAQATVLARHGRWQDPHLPGDDHAGTLETIDPTLVTLLLQNGYVPVLTRPRRARRARRSTSMATSWPWSWRPCSARTG